MSDDYNSWSELIRHNEAETDYRIHCVPRDGSSWLVAAPHGGGIEPGTTEVARAIAGCDFGFYSIEGLKPSGNTALHITSHRFDEPEFGKIVVLHNRVISIHGCCDADRSAGISVWVGGADVKLAATALAALTVAGYEAREDSFTPGAEPGNLCNRGRCGGGLQLELSEKLRRCLFKNLTREGRKTAKPEMATFTRIVRRLLKAV